MHHKGAVLVPYINTTAAVTWPNGAAIHDQAAVLQIKAAASAIHSWCSTSNPSCLVFTAVLQGHFSLYCKYRSIRLPASPDGISVQVKADTGFLRNLYRLLNIF